MLVLCAFAESTDASCGSISTYTATMTLNTFGHTFYSNNEDCVWYIKPSSSYISGYYLEIKWTRFNIEGDMPGCSYDSVEIFLTKYVLFDSKARPSLTIRLEITAILKSLML